MEDQEQAKGDRVWKEVITDDQNKGEEQGLGGYIFKITRCIGDSNWSINVCGWGLNVWEEIKR